MWHYATSGYRLVDPDIDKRIVHTLKSVILISTTINIIGVILAFFVSWAGYFGFVAMAYMIITTVYGRFRAPRPIKS
jgi:hypothetical protein